MISKKFVSFTEIFILVYAILAFAYLSSDRDFSVQQKENIFSEIIERIFSPVFKIVSATPVIVSGCCLFDKNDEVCTQSAESDCFDSFYEGESCNDISECDLGCCYDSESGEFNPRTRRASCEGMEFSDDVTCGEQAVGGCCVIETNPVDVRYVNEIRCNNLIRENGVTGFWRRNIPQSVCQASHPRVQDMIKTQQWIELLDEEVIDNDFFNAVFSNNRGACIYADREENIYCNVTNERECRNTFHGDFNNGKLCTADFSLSEKICEKTDKTICFEGKVYYTDSCGNPANIYDSSKYSDTPYWENIVSPENLCGANSLNGNARSLECGNCNEFSGSICSNALLDNIKPAKGDNYCKPNTCNYGGAEYKSGESWCVYEGKIGDGDDVVGSEHFRLECKEGTITPEICGEKRSRVCVESSELEVHEGVNVPLRQAFCRAGMQTECADVNNDEEEDSVKKEKCESIGACFWNVIAVGEQKKGMCFPEHPTGITQCSTLSVNCTGSNCGVEFFRYMNTLCMRQGDCGLSANFVGELSTNDSYILTRSPPGNIRDAIRGGVGTDGRLQSLSLNSSAFSEYKNLLKALANPRSNNVVKNSEKYVEDTDAEAGERRAVAVADLFGTTTEEVKESDPKVTGSDLWGGFSGILGIVATGLGGMLGGPIGMIIGLAVSALPLIGDFLKKAFSFIGDWNWGQNDDEDEEVSTPIHFECLAWHPPYGSADCEKCNGDPLKPCSDYRCWSLGTSCVYEEGKGCYAEADDKRAPVISFGGIFSVFAEVVSSSGNIFRIADKEKTCFDENGPKLQFKINSSERASCKYGLSSNFDFSTGISAPLTENKFVTEHTFVYDFNLGLSEEDKKTQAYKDWNGEANLFVKCVDVYGHYSERDLQINFCMNKEPDKTPPVIFEVIPAQESSFAKNKETVNVLMKINEKAECRVDSEDKEFKDMSTSFSCLNEKTAYYIDDEDNYFGAYVCTSQLNVGVSENPIFYIGCKDQPDLCVDEGESLGAVAPDNVKACCEGLQSIIPEGAVGTRGTCQKTEGAEYTSPRNVNDAFIYSIRRAGEDFRIDSVVVKNFAGDVLPLGQESEGVIPLNIVTRNSKERLFFEVSVSGGSEENNFCNIQLDGSEKDNKRFESELYLYSGHNFGRGEYNVEFICKDEVTGEENKKTLKIEIAADDSELNILRVLRDENSGILRIKMSHEVEMCKYSTNSSFDYETEGNVMTLTDGFYVTGALERNVVYTVSCNEEFRPQETWQFKLD